MWKLHFKMINKTKKAAMFDTFLRHSEELRDAAISFKQNLQRLRHFVRNDVVHANKKAAMFGLDARIALAILGALTVITGAVLHSAILNSKAIALLTDLEEQGKAWESYYLDTGTNLPQVTIDPGHSNFYTMRNTYLINKPSNVTGWNGPYINYENDESLYWWLEGKYGGLYIRTLKPDDGWAKWSDGLCTVGEKCAVWSYMHLSTPNEALAKKMDEKVDYGDGPDKGKFRWRLSSNLGLRIAPIKNPND